MRRPAKRWAIHSAYVDMGIYEGDTEEDALDAMARDAGYEDFARACEVAPGDELVVVEIREGGTA